MSRFASSGFSLALLALTCLVIALCFGAAPAAVGGTAAQVANPSLPSQRPTVTTVNPATAAATMLGGIAFPTPATVTGSNFRPGATVKIGAEFALTVSVSPTKIEVSVPGQAAGTVDVTVTNTDGTSVTLPKGFTYSSGPIVYGLLPATGNAAMPTVVTVSGGNLQGDSAITVGGKPAPIQFFFSSGSLQAEVPPNTNVPADGKTSGAVVVTNADGQSFTLPNGFTWTSQQEPAAAPVSRTNERTSRPLG
jgi:hypothetical protein